MGPGVRGESHRRKPYLIRKEYNLGARPDMKCQSGEAQGRGSSDPQRSYNEAEDGGGPTWGNRGRAGAMQGRAGPV